MRRRGNVPEWASLSETNDFGSLNVGTTYNINDVQLAQFARASAVAQGYQFFRIKKITFKVQPLLDAAEAATPGIGNQANLGKRSPWLNTNTNAYVPTWAPSQVSHTGHVMKITAPASAIQMTYRMVMTAEFEFKKPLALIQTSEQETVVNLTTPAQLTPPAP